MMILCNVKSHDQAGNDNDIYFASAKAKFGGEEEFERETNKVFISRKVWLLLLF